MIFVTSRRVDIQQTGVVINFDDEAFEEVFPENAVNYTSLTSLLIRLALPHIASLVSNDFTGATCHTV